MKRNSSRYLRLFIAVYVALLGIIIPSTADIPTTLVVTAYFDNSPINLVDIPTVSRMMNDVFLESAHRGNPWSYDVSNRYMSQNNPVRSTYPSLYMPRPGTPTRNFANQISPTPNRTGNMGRGSARDSRSHGNSRSGRGRFGWRNSRRYSGTGQNSGFRNTNSQAVTRRLQIK